MALLLGLLLMNGADASAQTLRAVIVHGSAVEREFLIEDPEVAARCLWGATYNMQGEGPAALRSDAPQVTLSFLTDSYWNAVEGEIAETGIKPAHKQTGFHTRVTLAVGGIPAYVESSKRGVPFGYAHGLLPTGQYILSLYGIPTMVDSIGRPVVREFTDAELGELPRIIETRELCGPAVGELIQPGKN